MGQADLHERARRLLGEFRDSGRPPLVVEFAGVPKAGKTSTLNHVYAFLRRSGFKCEVVVERASVCPIKDKRHFNFNIWTACTTLAQLLEKTQEPPRLDDPDILFLDRGVFDALCWLSLLERLARIRPEDRQHATEFFLTQDWTRKVSGVIAMTANAKDALKREQGLLPVPGSGGSIMNTTVLKQARILERRRGTSDVAGRLRTGFAFCLTGRARSFPQCRLIGHPLGRPSSGRNTTSRTEAARLTAALVDQAGTTVKPGKQAILDIDDTFGAAMAVSSLCSGTRITTSPAPHSEPSSDEVHASVSYRG
jgi:predicted ATPase